MKIALLADIHGNADALSAVLSDARDRAVDELLIAGDFVGYYYEPDRVLALLREWRWSGVVGNHELLLAQWIRGEGREELRSKYGSGFEEAEQRLQPAETRMLLGLPATRTCVVDGRSVLLCHGTPWDTSEYVYPDDASGRLARMAEGGEDLVVYGHTHYPLRASFASTLVLNPGSVGQPRDRGPDAAWAVWDTTSNDVTMVRTPYDSRRLIAACRERDPGNVYLTAVLDRL